MPASFNVRDWIGWGAEKQDPGWKSRATAWFNELVAYSRENRADIDTAITDFNDHLNNAGWTDPVNGTTFSRLDSTTVSGRIGDYYSATYERYVNSVRQSFHSATNETQYDSGGSNEIYRLNRTNRRMEHHSGAMLSGAANFYTNWSNFGGSYETCQWERHPDGTVNWRGLALRSVSASGTPSAILLTDGNARISGSQQIFTVMSSSGALRLDAFTNGQLVIQSTVVSGGTNITTIPAGGWVSLNGVSYRDHWR